MRPRMIVACVFAGLTILTGGCPTPEPPAPITVELVNETSLDVRPELFASAAATDDAGLFVSGNRVTTFTDRPFPELRGGETVTLTYECENLLAIGSDSPVLFDATQLTVATSEDQVSAFQDADFACGATVRVVYFTQGAAFHVRIDAQ